jgi:8-oxo-dGTP pyrophosphatase MutT (NUDIX family)
MDAGRPRGGSKRRAGSGGSRPRRGAVEEVSAGGVVVRGDDVLLIVPTRRAANGSRVVALPKGHLDGDETAEQAAMREVREEGGVDADLVSPLGEVRYHYRRDGRLVSKVVHFFHFAFRSGSPANHDHEIEDARWVPIEQAVTELSYPGERDMVRRVLSKTRADR